ncbi:hypothetical protein NBRC116594_05500 [Shimia sp. NS0008-38b]|uniref:hypothetical protein n=1 Tax=Shimia sp. NS0008-38b TaxID=3127653 RepID=UPI003106BAE8
MKFTILCVLSLIAVPTLAVATPPLACEGVHGNVFLSVAGSAVQIWRTDSARQTGVALQMSQEHEEFPSAWSLSVAGAQSTLVVHENVCDTVGGQFPLSFSLIVDQRLTYGCCTVAE